MPGVVGLILAGGEARRFGGDKLAALVDGEASVARVARVLREAGAELVYAVVRGAERCRLYTSLAGLDGCVYDPEVGGCGGPGVALAAAAGLPARLVYVAPGDAPWLEPGVYRVLSWFVGPASIAVPLHGDGFLESLVAVVDGGYAAGLPGLARRLCGLRGDVRPVDYVRAAPLAALVGSGLLASSPTVFAHINRREDVRARGPKNPLGGKDVVLLGGGLRLGGDLCSALLAEARRYRGLGLGHLYIHAARDYALLCGGGMPG